MARLIISVLFFLSLFVSAKEYSFENFVFDFSDGWSKVESNDPQSVLKIAKGNSSIEFIKMEEELSDFYLKSKLEKQRESFIENALNPSSIRTASIHGKAVAYYLYYDDTTTNIVCLFTYGEASFMLITKGISESVFKNMIYTFRNAGEKIEQPAPQRKTKRKKIKIKEKQETESRLQYFFTESSTATVSTGTLVSASTYTEGAGISTVSVETEKQIGVTQTEGKKEEFESEKIFPDLMKKEIKPLINRKPVNKFLMLGFIAFYFIVVFIFKARFAGYKNPKMTLYPKEMTPDFLFPLIITRVKTATDTMFQIITRTNQFLTGSISHEYRKFYVPGMLGLIYLHVLWSLSEFIKDGFFVDLVLKLPLGGIIISFIELPFIILIIYGVVKKKSENPKITVTDMQTNVICEVEKKNGELVVLDSKQREVARLKKTGTYFKREWDYLGEEGEFLLKVKDEHPDIWTVTRLFGNKLIGVRSFYTFYKDDKMIGFVYIDPSSKNNYQIHFDYAYFRLIKPIQLAAAVLYIISTDREEGFLFI